MDFKRDREITMAYPNLFLKETDNAMTKKTKQTNRQLHKQH